jgi:hypothetical protein
LIVPWRVSESGLNRQFMEAAGIEPACRFPGDLQGFRDYGVLGPVANLASRLSTQAAAARPIDRSQTFIG